MSIDVKIPEFSESISEGSIGAWIKNVGDIVEAGETIVEVETDKVVLEIPAPAKGKITKILKQENDVVNSQELVAVLEEIGAGKSATANDDSVNEGQSQVIKEKSQPMSPGERETTSSYKKTSPAVRKLIEENNLDVENIGATGKNNRITKSDVMAVVDKSSTPLPARSEKVSDPKNLGNSNRVPMSSLRKRISERLVSAQHEYAMLTTFNEVNMQRILDIRQDHKEQFLQTHGIKLGFMSFFVLAVVEALKEYPIINSSIDNEDVVYHQFVDMGIAVSSERGLVVPVVRDVHLRSLSDIELEINDLATRARDNKLAIDDLVGGTFTITNGGVFGSMMSTPIINPPQSAILGMHSIEKRPIAVGDEVQIAPMMYLALTYDHRIIDGREAVQFLSSVKRIIEDPIQLLLHI